MGNSSTKEQRPPPSRLRSADLRSASLPTSSPSANSNHEHTQTPTSGLVTYSSRNGRGSRSELTSLLGVGNAPEREMDEIENRRETRQEREARRLQRERVLREKERERSMREEGVDGGFLVTQGVYTGVEDYNKSVVRQLMVWDFYTSMTKINNDTD